MMDTIGNAQFGFAPALALALLHALWQCSALAVIAALALQLLARRSAALRHAVGMGFLIAMVALPALEFAGFWARPAVEITGSWMPALSASVVDVAPGRFVQQSDALAWTLSLLWLFGATAMLLRHMVGWRLIGQWARQPYATLPPEWQVRVDRLQQAFGISRTVVVRLGDEVMAPFTARVLRPVIWLPLSLLTRLPTDQVEALIAHELAHVRRLDWIANGLQCIAESLLFFHPAAWWLSRRIRQEREHACDDLAALACGDAIALAEALTELERLRYPTPRLLLSASGGSLMTRITRLLSPMPTRRRGWWPLGLVALLTSTALLAISADPNRELPGLRIESSTDGDLGPGDYREITASGLDRTRYYRVSVDADGRITEQYQENGQDRPIDRPVRLWLSEMSRLGAPPPPPALPAPPPELPALPELPPPPPEPPALTESSDFNAILRLVAADPRVVRQSGQPITVVQDTFDGFIRSVGDDSTDGSAELSFIVTGPSGRTQIDVAATQSQGQWTLTQLDAKP